MSTLVCIPVTRVKCRIHIDKGRAWTPVEELILWAISRRSHSIGDLVSETNLPHQVVVAAISRLSRFRFAKVVVQNGSHKFVASRFGAKGVSSGDPLPFFPKRTEAWVSFVIERVSGRILTARDVRRIKDRDLKDLLSGPVNRRPVMFDITGGALDIGPDAMIERIGQFVTRGRDEKLAKIEPGTSSLSNEYIGVTVENGITRDLPEKAGSKLRDLVIEAAAVRGKTRTFSVRSTFVIERESGPSSVACDFSPDDIVIGGSAQRTLFTELLKRAASRVVIHSTFIAFDDILALLPSITEACSRDVEIDILWGAAHGDEAKSRYGETASRLSEVVRNDPVLRRRVRLALKSTGSHAKLMLLDTLDGDWIGAVSSCNWLKSPFRSVEITTLLRHPKLVARIASALQRMSGDRGLADALASELAILNRDLSDKRGTSGTAQVSMIMGEEHDAVMRLASSEAHKHLVIGTHKLGSTARPGALLPAEAAAGPRKSVKVLYTVTTGPLKNRHARELQNEAAGHGVRLMQMRDIPLHGKFLLWDSDNVVTSSLNWGSASTSESFPLGDIGVHVRAPGIADSVMGKLTSIFPKLRDEELTVPT